VEVGVLIVSSLERIGKVVDAIFPKPVSRCCNSAVVVGQARQPMLGGVRDIREVR